MESQKIFLRTFIHSSSKVNKECQALGKKKKKREREREREKSQPDLKNVLIRRKVRASPSQKLI